MDFRKRLHDSLKSLGTIMNVILVAWSKLANH